MWNYNWNGAEILKRVFKNLERNLKIIILYKFHEGFSCKTSRESLKNLRKILEKH